MKSSAQQFYCNSLADTKALAQRLALCLQGNETIILSGELGSGKTTFVQYLAAALDIKENITSPTFNIVRSYNGKYPLRHFDMYRLQEAELAELGFEELMQEQGINVIEWNKAPLLADIITIQIDFISESARLFSIQGIEL